MNLQVHCTHCDKSLYRATRGDMTEPPSVVLYDRGMERSFGGLGDESRHEFCDWVCVERWARDRANETCVTSPEVTP